MPATETWKPIPGYEGLYEVSDLGRVNSVKRTCPKWDGWRTVPERILRGTASCGYPRVGLCRDGEDRTHLVHHLVLLAFVGPCPEGMQRCHNDGDQTNCRLENLRYDTPEANYRDRDAHGRLPRGGTHHKAKLTATDVLRIRAEYGSGGVSQVMLATRNNVSPALIGAITTRKIWRHI